MITWYKTEEKLPKLNELILVYNNYNKDEPYRDIEIYTVQPGAHDYPGVVIEYGQIWVSIDEYEYWAFAKDLNLPQGEL